MKRLGALLMAGLLAGTMCGSLALAGCGSRKKADFVMPEGGFDTSKQVTIRFYHQMGGQLQNILAEYITAFEKRYPNIHVEHRSQGDWNGVRKQITTEIQGGNQPNIAYCYADHVALYNRSGAVQAIDDFLPGGAFDDVTVPTVLTDSFGTYVDAEGNTVTEPVTADLPLNLTEDEAAKYNKTYYDEGSMYGDGKMYTLPWIKSTEMMFYNADFFNQHSDRISVPKTWDEMEETCAEILEICEEENIEGVVPLGYDSEENLFISQCAQLDSPYTSETGTKFLFDNDTNKQFVNKFIEWKEKGYFTTAALASSDYTSTLFTEGSIIMSIGSTGGATYNVDASGSVEQFEVGIAPVPQYDVNNTKLISQGPSVCIFKSNDPQEVLASWLFVKFFTTNPYYQTEVAQNNGYMPVLKREFMETIPAYVDFIAEAEDKDIRAMAVREGMLNQDNYFVSPAFYGSSVAREQVGLLMQAALSGDKTVDKAFSDALTTCTKRYGK